MAKKVKTAGKKEGSIQGFAEGYLMTALKSPGRFVKLTDGWIKDFVLGVDWGPSSDKRMDFEDAKKYCSNLKGRLPERLELISLVDDTKHHPAINPIFTDTKTDDYYWSGTPLAGFDGSAWIVDFFSGNVDNSYENGSNYVRPVRSSQ